MATYQSAYTGSQIDAGINNSLIYTGYTSSISGNSGTITNAGLAAAISSLQPVQLNFVNWQGEGGAICRFLNDTVSGIIYGALDSDGRVGIVTFTVNSSTVTWSLTKPRYIYTDYNSVIPGYSGTINDAGLAAAISAFQPVQLNFVNWGGEGGAICTFLNDTMGGIVYGAIDTDGSIGIVTFTVQSSTVTWSLVKPGLPYLTTAPTAANTNGLKIVQLTSEPSQKYSGYLYFITST